MLEKEVSNDIGLELKNILFITFFETWLDYSIF